MSKITHKYLQNNWYINSQESNDLTQEAGFKENFLGLAWAVALVLSGLSIEEASQKSSLPISDIEISMQDNDILEKADEFMHNGTPSNNIPQDEQISTPTQPNSTQINFGEIKNLITKHEVGGTKTNIHKVYPDPIHGMKVPTIGIGYNLNKSEAKQEIENLGLNYQDILSGKQSLTPDQVDSLFIQDLSKAVRDARIFLPNFDSQPTAIKTIIIDMSFNLGLTRLSKFQKLRKALVNYNYPEATKEMKDSKWYNQVGNRSRTLVNMMRNQK